jgi:hypothetical protein
MRACADCAKALSEEPRVYLNAELRARCGPCSNRLGKDFSGAAYKQLRQAQRLSPQDFALSARDSVAAVMGELAEFSQGLIGRILERQPRSRAALG